ncbi:MAG: TauD/TfdA family dioxygenase, partial [Burkholderiales bacterium]
MGAPERLARGSPFALDAAASYRAWRERKLTERPTTVEALVVEVRDPFSLSAAERDAIVDRCRRANLAVYAAPAHLQDKSVPQQLGRQLGLERLDGNWLADEDGISSLTVSGEGDRRGYIPYTNRPIRWHTDGYYNPPERTIRAMLLHCVQPAETGGENRVMDHEIAYLLLRDQDPELVRALEAPDAMTIPARAIEGESDGAPG